MRRPVAAVLLSLGAAWCVFGPVSAQEQKEPVLDPKLAALDKRLKTSAQQDRIKALEETGKLGEEAAPLARTICEAALDRSPKIVEAALVALGKVQPSRAKPLTDVLTENDPEKLIDAFQKLADLRENAAAAEPVMWAELKKIQAAASLSSAARADLIQANVSALVGRQVPLAESA
jgi:hypothetical protein